MPSLHLTGDSDADALLSSDPFALLVGMLLDQQVPMETAFAGPAKIRTRLGALEPGALAVQGDDELTAVFREPPAVHRFPGSMAARTRALAQAVIDDWDGSAAAIWTRDDPDAATVLRRLKALPGFGAEKSKILLALLGKQYDVRPEGWQAASAPYGEPGTTVSVADIVDADSLRAVRAAKQAAKQAAKAVRA